MPTPSIRSPPLATGDTLACIFDNEGRLESGNHHFDMCFGTGILTLPQIFSGADEAFYRRLPSGRSGG